MQKNELFYANKANLENNIQNVWLNHLKYCKSIRLQ